jgi:hypothetical protein
MLDRTGVKAMLGLEELQEGPCAGDLAPEVLAAANINPTTRIATDYLNHFNNVVMLLEFIATMPDFVEEVLQWRPIDYTGYFATSHFRQRDLAIAAYAAADTATRARFEQVIGELDMAVLTAQALLKDRSPDHPDVRALIDALLHEQMQPLIAEASGVINGPLVIAEEAIDPHAGCAQHSIDELFG